MIALIYTLQRLKTEHMHQIVHLARRPKDRPKQNNAGHLLGTHAYKLGQQPQTLDKSARPANDREIIFTALQQADESTHALRYPVHS